MNNRIPSVRRKLLFGIIFISLSIIIPFKYPKKLLMLGNSFTFGLGVTEEQNFVSIIQRHANATSIGIINGAQCGFCIEQSYSNSCNN